jgi:hypothetical protein
MGQALVSLVTSSLPMVAPLITVISELETTIT